MLSRNEVKKRTGRRRWWRTEWKWKETGGRKQNDDAAFAGAQTQRIEGREGIGTGGSCSPLRVLSMLKRKPVGCLIVPPPLSQSAPMPTAAK